MKMTKRFKLKISRVFQSCRSKDPSNLPSNPVPSILRFSLVNRNSITRHLPPPGPPLQPSSLPKPPHYASLKRHVSSAFSTIGCGLGLGLTSSVKYLSETDHRSEPPAQSTLDFHWEKEDSWHVIARVLDDDETPRPKIYNTSENDDDLFPPPPPPNTEKKKRRFKKKKTRPKPHISTSSAESGMFSSESFEEYDINGEETETLVSSTDSSSEMFNANLEAIRESKSTRRKMKKHKKVKNKKETSKRHAVSFSSSENESPARLSSFLQRMIPCTVDGKVRESFAVVKKSEDPYEDFKKSMMDMILEKQMFEEKDLEQLLHCFLSLNSRHHHGVIVQAFTEIWEALFSRRSTSVRVSCTLNS